MLTNAQDDLGHVKERSLTHTTVVEPTSPDPLRLEVYLLILVLSAPAIGPVLTLRGQYRQLRYPQATARAAPVLRRGGGNQCLPYRTT